MVQVNTDKIKQFWGNNKQTILVVAAALLLTIALLAVRAGSPFAGFEVESGNLSGNALVRNDLNVSGGKYVEFTSGSTGDAAFTVSIETPEANTQYASGSSLLVGVKLSADAPENTRVEFYQNGTKFDARPRVPYLGVFEKPQDGTYDLQAIAIDSQGKRAVSSTVRVKVQTGVDSCSGVTVSPGDNLQNAINQAGSGGTVCFNAGTYNISSTLTPLSGQKLIGKKGARIYGGKVITNWQYDSIRQLWKATGQTQQSTPLAKFGCEDGYPRCAYNEDIFVNKNRYRHVDSINAVGTNDYFFDYNNDIIWLKDDPRGKTVESTVTQTFLSGSAKNVEVRGLVVEMFAAAFQQGASDLGTGSSFYGNEFAYNHGRSFKVISGEMTGNYLHDNGQHGFGCGGSNSKIYNNHIEHNGYIYTAGGSTGGNKCSLTDGTQHVANISRDNNGNGLWTDIDNSNSFYEFNLLEDNVKNGIFHEVSFSAEIRYNIARRNGFGTPRDKVGGGIFLGNSEGVKIHHNEVEGNHVSLGLNHQDRSHNAGADRWLRNVEVYENTVFHNSNHIGFWLDQSYDIEQYYSTANIKYRDNIYYLKNPSGNNFLWKNNYINQNQWRNVGNDVNGEFYQW